MRGWLALLAVLALVCDGAWQPAAAAGPPSFSIDSASASLGGPITPDDILAPGPSVVTEGSALGMLDTLPFPFDELNALSFGRSLAAAPTFTVDRQAVGKPGTQVEAESLAADASGDIFSTDGLGSNDLLRDESLQGLIGGFFGDDLDALAVPVSSSVYFSIDADSASAGTHPANTIYLDHLDNPPFASGASMGLHPDDDIDALAVDDLTNPGQLDPGVDSALFSLSPFSHSVLIGGLSPGAIYRTYFEDSHELFKSAAELGLRSDDNLNGLETIEIFVPPPVPALRGGALAALATLLLGLEVMSLKGWQQGEAQRRVTAADAVKHRTITAAGE